MVLKNFHYYHIYYDSNGFILEELVTFSKREALPLLLFVGMEKDLTGRAQLQPWSPAP